MLSRPYSAAILGIDGYPVTVECSVSTGINNYEIVGLPDNAVKESKEMTEQEEINTICEHIDNM